MLIVPATLRKQWQQELLEKFHLRAQVLDAATYRAAGRENPFMDDRAIHLCSYQFAAARAAAVRAVPWDLVVLDEAHRLRNVYRDTSKIAQAIKAALEERPKLLLTATPLQNSLLELYGLASLLDPWVFGELASFRQQFMRSGSEQKRNQQLRARLEPFCRRTLRRQVQEYVRFTRRVPITQSYAPTDAEQKLYEEVSAYLQREVSHALPAGQRTLLVLVLRKLLASSTFAIAGTLRILVSRLEQMEASAASATLIDEEDFEAIDEVSDEWAEPSEGTQPTTPQVDIASLRAELAELRRYARDAEAIEHNAKGDALLTALQGAFESTATLGAARKAVIFTESRRTQTYLARLLGEHGYQDEMVLINGVNNDLESGAIYQRWLERHRGSDQVSGVHAADVKAALVEEFRDRATLLIATESAAEGVNLQFSSLVVNYDLPWNPQRVEQRIGRCHRYGQKHDVVVVNFLNERNAADRRVFQLLSQKFRLFEGVFGASDEILGAVEAGVDVERRIFEVYQSCRTAREIDEAFDSLQAELSGEIDDRLRSTQQAILEHFDEEVHSRLKRLDIEARQALEGHQALLWKLAQIELAERATFDSEQKSFDLCDDERPPYFLQWPMAEESAGVFFHPEDSLAQELIQQAKGRTLRPSRISFFYTALPRRSALEPHLGKSGRLDVVRLRITGRQEEEHLLATAVLDDGTELAPDVAEKLFGLEAQDLDSSEDFSAETTACAQAEINRVLGEATRRNEGALHVEEAKLEQWAEETKENLENGLKELDREIREARRASRITSTLDSKLEHQRRIKDLEGRRNRKRRDLFAEQDKIEEQREELIEAIRLQLELRHEVQPVFQVRFSLIDRRGAQHVDE